MSEQKQRGEEIFETLNKNKKRKRQKLICNVVILLTVIAVVLIGVVLHLRNNVRERFAATEADVLSYAVTTGTIHTTVSGSGVLAVVDEEDRTLPTGVEIKEVIAKAGDIVSEGDLLATVDMSTVMSALSDLQDQLDDLDSDINSAKGETISSYIRAGVSGRVKILYGEKGMDVTSCMARNGALAILSLDGHMAVDIETDKLSRGDTVSVTRADGSVIEGEVESAAGDKATILVTDNGPKYDEEVSVTAGDGTEVGSGKLYIHNPLAVTGYAGTIRNVSAKENGYVNAYTNLFTLTDTSFSASYDALLREREKLEEKLMNLLTVYRDGAVLAPFDGMVTAVTYDEDADATTYTTADGDINLLTVYPKESMAITISVDETDIMALEDGQEAEVEVSSVSEEQLFTGLITDISKVADTSTGVTQYSAEVTVDYAEGMLPGMTASVDVKIEGIEDALIIPVDALHQTSTIYYVYTTYDEETQQYGGMTEVTIGMQNDSFVEITSGLQIGDTVYYTEKETFNFAAMFGGMGGMGGMSAMPSGGSNRNDGGMPSMGNMSSGRMPNMGGR